MCDECLNKPKDETCWDCYRDKEGNVTELCDICFKKKLKKERG